MQKLLDGIAQRLRAFVAQRDELALVVRCTDEEAPVVLKSLEELDEGSTSEMVWIVSDEFHDAASWVSAVVDDFAVKHGAVRLAMAQQGMAPWPPLPPEVLDETRPPAERLRELAAFSRLLLPAPDGFLSVWCLLPLSVGDPAAYAALVAELLAHDFPNPWCHHLRFFVRGDPADPALPAALAAIPRVAWYEPELSQAAMQRALEEEAADPSQPLGLRLQNLLMGANVDYAYGRFDASLAKYAVLLKYYAGIRDGAMAALVLNGIGEVHERLGNVDQAGVCYEMAFAPAAQAPGPPVPVMLNVVLNLANLRMALGRWEEGEAYCDAAQQLATIQRAPDVKLLALENLGRCQYMQGKVPEALATWHAGAEVAGALEMPEPRRSMLERLQVHYEAVEDRASQAQVARELALPVGAPPIGVS
jgi:tetratricopeptide (TPR) repeat protein